MNVISLRTKVLVYKTKISKNYLLDALKGHVCGYKPTWPLQRGKVEVLAEAIQPVVFLEETNSVASVWFSSGKDSSPSRALDISLIFFRNICLQNLKQSESKDFSSDSELSSSVTDTGFVSIGFFLCFLLSWLTLFETTFFFSERFIFSLKRSINNLRLFCVNKMTRYLSPFISSFHRQGLKCVQPLLTWPYWTLYLLIKLLILPFW